MIDNIMHQLGSELYNFHKVNNKGATVFLGAGSSISSLIMSWPNMATDICNRFNYQISENVNSIDTIKNKIYEGVDDDIRYSWIKPYLDDKNPSLGHQHLAQLALAGYIDTIITTNWDCLLEEGLSKLIPADKIKVYVRGLVPDNLIAKALEQDSNFIKVIKLHGDIHTQEFMITDQEIDNISDKLEEQLVNKFNKISYLIGTSISDINLLKTLFKTSKHSRSKYNILFSEQQYSEIDKTLEKMGFQTLLGNVDVVTLNHDKINIGDFIEFFTQLNISVQKSRINEQEQKLKMIENEILSKEEVGLRYINSAQIREQIEEFTMKIKRENPDLIIFINDPKAPGGLEVKRRILSTLNTNNILHHDLEISGEKGSRVFKRSAKWVCEVDQDCNNINKIVIIDAITFSGKTMELAKRKVQELYPNVVTKCGVLVISKMLYDDPSSPVDFSNAITDRHEIHFPWGVTQATGQITRKLKNIFDERKIEIDKRPWGALEILANDEFCSVRQLTLEAGERLSFQRHFCRDELYVALDDHIGLKIATNITQNDGEKFDEFNPQIQSLTLEKGDYILIPRGVWHRPEAYMNRVRILEISFGVYDQVFDIERQEDSYARETIDGGK